jgi:hypothetical protein
MLTSVLLANLVLIAAAPPPGAEEVLARLDLTSFPNSTGPRHLQGPATPAAAGFSEASSGENGWAFRTIPGDGTGGWQLGLRVLETNGEAVVVCFTDIARNGGSYFVQTALTLTPTADGYTARPGPERADCPEWRRRSDAAPPA